MDIDILKENHVLKIIKVGRKLYTGWYQGYPKYKYPISILISDVSKKYNEGDFLLISRSDFYVESLAYTNNTAERAHNHRLTKYGFGTARGGLLTKDKIAIKDKGQKRK